MAVSGARYRENLTCAIFTLRGTFNFFRQKLLESQLSR
jgi:hypothetical protein